MARFRLSQTVDQALSAAAARYDIPVDWLRRISRIESGWNPTATRGAYHGLFQLSESEFRRVGGTGSRLDPDANAMAGAALLASHRDAFRRRYGSEPGVGDLYLIHQQGWGGYQAHRDNPDAPAWQNMLGTREGRERPDGPEWARRAIAGNIPRSERGRMGDVGNITSRQFVDMWNARFTGDSGAGGTTRGIGEVRTPPPTTTGVNQFPEEFRAPAPDTGPTTRVTPGAIRPNLTDRTFNPAEGILGPADTGPGGGTPPPGNDRLIPSGRELLSSIFGAENVPGPNKNLASAFGTAGRTYAEMANRPAPKIDLSLLGQLPEQDASAFVLPERRRRT